MATMPLPKSAEETMMDYRKVAIALIKAYGKEKPGVERESASLERKCLSCRRVPRTLVLSSPKRSCVRRATCAIGHRPHCENNGFCGLTRGGL